MDGFTAPEKPPRDIRLFKMPPVGRKEGCAAWACDQFKGMYVYSFSWRLPAGFTCDKCKLVMHYLTASSCWPPCPGGGGQGCTKPVPYGFCGAPGASYPEE
jgi:hypothetical protein